MKNSTIVLSYSLQPNIIQMIFAFHRISLINRDKIYWFKLHIIKYEKFSRVTFFSLFSQKKLSKKKDQKKVLFKDKNTFLF